MPVLTDLRLKFTILIALPVLVFCGCQKKADIAAAVDVNADTCALRLQTIEGAKEHWAEQNQKTTNDTPTWDDLKSFMRNVPVCPSGGTYTIGTMGELPSCSIPAHNERFKKGDAAP